MAKRRYQSGPKRRSATFAVCSAEHQRLTLEAYEVLLEREPLKWRRTRLAWLMRRVNATLQVHARKGAKRKQRNSRDAAGLE
jgi:hypothetical protein